jgi:signal transduction histidine kinase
MAVPEAASSRLRSALRAPCLGAPERARVRANLRVSLVAGVVGASFGLAANALAGRTASTFPLAGLALVLLLALELLRRGRDGQAGVLSLGGIVLAIDCLLILGQGIHDRSAVLFPVVILIAGLTFDRRLLVLTTLACIVSAAVVAHLENAGLLRQTAFTASLGWLPIVEITIILTVTAVAVDLLVSDVVRGLREANDKGERLAEANRELASRNAELERFTDVVSHDLKSPLVTIRGFLGYVERDAREGRTARIGPDLGRIRAATERMGQLLDDLLELSRTGRLERPRADVPLDEVVREARSLVEGRFSAKGVRLVVEERLPAVHGDRRALVDLFQNLLENAAKFTNGAGPEPVVEVSARTAGGGLVEVAVSDNGLGIDPAHHERVFELFQRLDPGQEGTGLGLALARRIVESHGGRIRVESEGEGRGATFRFTLPAAVAASAPSAG